MKNLLKINSNLLVCVIFTDIFLICTRFCKSTEAFSLISEKLSI